MQTSCHPDNALRTIDVLATDVDGIVAVVLQWVAPDGTAGERSMALVGGRWRAVLGPFDDVGRVAFRLRAVDGGGASTTTPTTEIEVKACPG